MTVLLFTLVATWNNYFLPLIMLSNPDFYPITRRAPALLAVGPAAECAKQ